MTTSSPPSSKEILEHVDHLWAIGLHAIPIWRGKDRLATLPFPEGQRFTDLADNPPSAREHVEAGARAVHERARPGEDPEPFANYLLSLEDFHDGLQIITGTEIPGIGYTIGYDLDRLPPQVPVHPSSATLLIEEGTGPGKWHLLAITRDRFEGHGTFYVEDETGSYTVDSKTKKHGRIIAEVMGRGNGLRSWPSVPPDKPKGYSPVWIRDDLRGIPIPGTWKQAVDSLREALSTMLGEKVEFKHDGQGRQSGTSRATFTGSRTRTPEEVAAAQRLEEHLDAIGVQLDRPRRDGYQLGFCPLPNHTGERNASFSINFERWHYHCWGCRPEDYRWLDQLADELGLPWPRSGRSGWQPAPPKESLAEPALLERDAAWIDHLEQDLADRPSDHAPLPEGESIGLDADDPSSRTGQRNGIIVGYEKAAEEHPEFFTITRYGEKLGGWRFTFTNAKGATTGKALADLLRLMSDRFGSKVEQRVIDQVAECLWRKCPYCEMHHARAKHHSHFTCKQSFCALCTTRETYVIGRIPALADTRGDARYRYFVFVSAFRWTEDESQEGGDVAEQLRQRIAKGTEAFAKASGWAAFKDAILYRAVCAAQLDDTGGVLHWTVMVRDDAPSNGKVDGAIARLKVALDATDVSEERTDEGQHALIQAMIDTRRHLAVLGGRDAFVKASLLRAFVIATKGRHLFQTYGAFHLQEEEMRDEARKEELREVRCDFVYSDGHVCERPTEWRNIPPNVEFEEGMVLAKHVYPIAWFQRGGGGYGSRGGGKQRQE